ncbi:unnamed protein product, partial [Candidula unifasciata]
VGNQCRTLTLPVQTRQKSVVEGEPPITVYFLGDTFELRRLIVRHPEVSETLPVEVARYKEIYMAYSNFMRSVHPDPSVMRWCRSQELQAIIEALHDEIVRLYRTFKRDIEVRGGQENNQQDAQQQFGTWVVM